MKLEALVANLTLNIFGLALHVSTGMLPLLAVALMAQAPDVPHLDLSARHDAVRTPIDGARRATFANLLCLLVPFYFLPLPR